MEWQLKPYKTKKPGFSAKSLSPHRDLHRNPVSEPLREAPRNPKPKKPGFSAKSLSPHRPLYRNPVSVPLREAPSKPRNPSTPNSKPTKPSPNLPASR
jgi:hypothetical protein